MNIRTILVSALTLIITLFVIKSFRLVYPIEISSSQRSTEFSIVGEGKVEASPIPPMSMPVLRLIMLALWS